MITFGGEKWNVSCQNHQWNSTGLRLQITYVLIYSLCWLFEIIIIMLERRKRERTKERENVHWDKLRTCKLITIECKDALSRGVFIKRIQRRVLLASLLLNRHISPRGGRCINRAPCVILFFSTNEIPSFHAFVYATRGYWLDIAEITCSTRFPET